MNSDLIVERERSVGYDSNIKELSGRRIVNLSHIITQARRLENHACKAKNPGHFSFKSEKREGLASILKFQCESCKETRSIHTDNKPTNEINLAATWGTMAIGKGHYHMEEMLSTMHIPTPSAATFKKYEEEVGKVHTFKFVLYCVHTLSHFSC